MKKMFLMVSVVFVSVAIMGLTSSAFAMGWNGGSYKYGDKVQLKVVDKDYHRPVDGQPTAQVPEPTTLIWLGMGLATLAAVSRKKIKS